MSSATLSVQSHGTPGALGIAAELPPYIARRRAAQRRQMLIVQAISTLLITLVLLIYSYAGTVSIAITAGYFLSSIGLIGFFIALSETSFNDRFEDHYLTIHQVAGHVALQLIFLLAAPQIGYVFLSVVFLIFGFGALRMTSGQATIAWILTMVGLAPIFLLTNTPIGMPFASNVDRVAAMLCYVMVVGQCAFVGLYGSSLRKMLYDRSFELKEANKRIE